MSTEEKVIPFHTWFKCEIDGIDYDCYFFEDTLSDKITVCQSEKKKLFGFIPYTDILFQHTIIAKGCEFVGGNYYVGASQAKELVLDCLRDHKEKEQEKEKRIAKKERFENNIVTRI